MPPETNQPDYDLVARYFAGEASPAEAMLIHEWIADPENKKIFDQMLKVWKLVHPEPEMHIPPASETWSSIHLAATTRPEKKKSIVRRLVPYTLAAAATGIAFIIIFTWNNKAGNHKSSQQQTASLIRKSAANEMLKQQLPDGSTIRVKAGSTVAYSADFNNLERNIQLTGEAYFDVHPDPSKPFIIETENLKIKVTGTSFNVSNDYKEEKIEVQVQTGVVEMYTPQQKIIVSKGETGIFDKKHSTLILKEGVNVNSMSYATKSFSFNDITLKEACGYLEHAFNVSIKMDEAKFSDCRITAAFENNSLTYILEVINATLNTSYRKDGNTIIIEGEGCK